MSEWTKPDWYMTPDSFGWLVNRVAVRRASGAGLVGQCHPADLAVHWETTAETVSAVVEALHGTYPERDM